MNNKKLLIIIIFFVLIILFLIKCNYIPIIEKYEELNILNKTNDSIIKYLVDIDDKINNFTNEINNKLIGAQQKYDDVTNKIDIFNTIGLTWVNYKPENYLKCLSHTGNSIWVNGTDPLIPNRAGLYLYMIQGKNLRIKYHLNGSGDPDTTEFTTGNGHYYIQLPIINSKQLRADSSLVRFSSSVKGPFFYGLDHLNTNCKGIGIHQSNAESQTARPMVCFLFDNEKIMLSVGPRTAGLHISVSHMIGGVLSSSYGDIKSTWVNFFTMDIPIE